MDVLFHSFRATVILEELLGDRAQATELVRSHLASASWSVPAWLATILLVRARRILFLGLTTTQLLLDTA